MEYENEKPVRRESHLYAGIFALIILAVFAGIGACRQCTLGKEKRVIRTPTDVSGFSVVFVDGTAVLSWTDSTDDYLDHLEISWSFHGTKSVQVDKGIERFFVSGLEVETMYVFELIAIDKWGNRSNGVLCEAIYH